MTQVVPDAKAGLLNPDYSGWIQRLDDCENSSVRTLSVILTMVIPCC